MAIIPDPVTLLPTDKVMQARELMDQQNVSGVPIVEGNGPSRWHFDSPRPAFSREF